MLSDTISAPTPKPPATVKAPSVAIEDSVVAEIATTPAADILIASVSLAEPIVPASGITRLVPNVAVEEVIANSSVPLILILTY